MGLIILMNVSCSSKWAPYTPIALVPLKIGFDIEITDGTLKAASKGSFSILAITMLSLLF
jgi:hypothetical protein